MTPNIEAEINRAARLGAKLEYLVYNKHKEGKLVSTGKNDDLLMGYWSLIFDYGKGIGCLLLHEFYAPAFALFRPLVEALVRACIVEIGNPDDVQKIRQDRFKVSYEKDGVRIDNALGTDKMFENFLKEVRLLLHSLTHSGTAQLGMRFDGDKVGASVTDDQQLVLLRASSNAAFLITMLVGKHYDFGDVMAAADRIFWEYGKVYLMPTGNSAP